MEGEDFAELVGSIYDAALDPRVWPVMLNCFAIRCRQVQPNRSLISPTHELAMTTPRGDREYLRAFTETWASHNFWKTSGKLW